MNTRILKKINTIDYTQTILGTNLTIDFCIQATQHHHQHGDIKIKGVNDVVSTENISWSQQTLNLAVAVQSFLFELSSNSTRFNNLTNSFMSLW